MYHLTGSRIMAFKFVKSIGEAFSGASYTPPEHSEESKLTLYHYNGCPYCSITRSVIESLGVEVELRNIRENPQHRDDLVKARGRATVPVLRITAPTGEDTWMPESRDIVRYLETI
jgi:glutaredoxin